MTALACVTDKIWGIPKKLKGRPIRPRVTYLSYCKRGLERMLKISSLGMFLALFGCLERNGVSYTGKTDSVCVPVSGIRICRCLKVLPPSQTKFR
jgi:hypothetical protein